MGDHVGGHLRPRPCRVGDDGHAGGEETGEGPGRLPDVGPTQAHRDIHGAEQALEGGIVDPTGHRHTFVDRQPLDEFGQLALAVVVADDQQVGVDAALDQFGRRPAQHVEAPGAA